MPKCVSRVMHIIKKTFLSLILAGQYFVIPWVNVFLLINIIYFKIHICLHWLSVYWVATSILHTKDAKLRKQRCVVKVFEQVKGQTCKQAKQWDILNWMAPKAEWQNNASNLPLKTLQRKKKHDWIGVSWADRQILNSIYQSWDALVPVFPREM